MGRVELVSRAICDAAGKSVSKARCVICEGGQCTMWKSFRDEARAALRAMQLPADEMAPAPIDAKLKETV
jgi:hypothetical protein